MGGLNHKFKKETIAIFLSAAVVCFLGVIYILSGEKDKQTIKLEKSEVVSESPSEISEQISPEPSPEVLIKVHVTGEVNNPGVFELKSGSRVDDAINSAGGATEDADLERINRADYIKDTQQIRVPKIGEVIQAAVQSPTSSESDPSDTRININTASSEQLQTLSGIGKTLAEAIIEYRSKKPFKTIEDIKNVSRIGEATFGKIKDYIKVE